MKLYSYGKCDSGWFWHGYGRCIYIKIQYSGFFNGSKTKSANKEETADITDNYSTSRALEKTFNGMLMEGWCYAYARGTKEYAYYDFWCWEIGNSKSTTAYNYIVQGGYKFAGGSANAYQTSVYDITGYCNDYVYPGTDNLKHLIPIP